MFKDDRKLTRFISVLLSVFCLTLLNHTWSFAQGQPSFQGGVSLALGMPQGDFDKNIDNESFGLNGNIGINFNQSPFTLGMELSYLIYGDETRTVPFSLTIPDVTVDVETSNNILLGHLLFRVQKPNGKIRPYADGLFGFNYLFTETTVENRNGTFGDDVAASTNFDDFALSYGGGGGIMFQVHQSDRTDKPNARDKRVFIDVRARYLLGSEAEYLKQGAIDRKDGKITVNPTKSRTNLFSVNLGVVFTF